MLLYNLNIILLLNIIISFKIILLLNIIIILFKIILLLNIIIYMDKLFLLYIQLYDVYYYYIFIIINLSV